MAQRALVLLLFVGSMWLVRAADTFRADGTSIAGVGVIPRSTAHPSGILTAPFIHANWPHLIANTVPLLVLGALVLIGGAGEFVFVTLICALIGGAGTWLFGESANHIGASGVIFGYVGYLLARPVFDRRLWSMLITIIVGALYGAMLFSSAMPRAGISWSAHFFGFLGGIMAASLLRRRAASRVEVPS
ncbi:MAG TPA: rhomboid family intramembrane serine protease [Thermoanaerobaculia bacterium]|nr:rhomboid family intramembrane serine protease [Thermoanaerobaculia bacterium]